MQASKGFIIPNSKAGTQLNKKEVRNVQQKEKAFPRGKTLFLRNIIGHLDFHSSLPQLAPAYAQRQSKAYKQHDTSQAIGIINVQIE